MENFKMRRNGGELLRATENTEEHNISTNSAKTMAAYGMTDSGMNYGTPSEPLNFLNDDPENNKVYGPQNEDREQRGKRLLEEALEKERKRKKAKEEGNKPAKRAGDFSFGPVSGNINRYGEGG